MPDEPLIPERAPAPTDSTQLPPPLGPPSFDPLPPPISPGASRILGFAKFSGGCVLTLLAGFLLAVTLFTDFKKGMGCAAAQLVYIVPAVLLLFRKREPAWAFGILFGGAIVLLLASICGDMSFH
jgi:hypothetical protein